MLVEFIRAFPGKSSTGPTLSPTYVGTAIVALRQRFQRNARKMTEIQKFFHVENDEEMKVR